VRGVGKEKTKKGSSRCSRTQRKDGVHCQDKGSCRFLVRHSRSKKYKSGEKREKGGKGQSPSGKKEKGLSARESPD